MLTQLRPTLNTGHPLNEGRVVWFLSLESAVDIVGRTALIAERGKFRVGGPKYAGEILTPVQFTGSDGLATYKNPRLTSLVQGGAGAFTVACWVFPTNANSAIILNKNGSSSTNWKVRIEPFGALELDVIRSTANDTYGTFGALSLSKWHRILLAFNNNSASIFIDGLKYSVSKSTGSGTYIAETPGTLYIGGDGSGGTIGFIDDVSVWNRPLSDAEAYTDFLQSSSGYPGALLWESVRRTTFTGPLNISVFGTDAISTSESATRLFVGSRSSADAPQISELISRLFTGARDATDVASSSEAADAVRSYFQDAIDSPLVSEVLAQAGNWTRSDTDTPQTSESASRDFVGSRDTTDSPVTSDTVARVRGQFRSATESPTSSEVATAVRRAVGSTTDAPHSSESVARSGVFVRSPSDTISPTDVARSGVDFGVAVDTVTLADAASVYKLSVACSDTISLADAVTGWNLSQSTSDSVTVSEAARSNIRAVSATDTVAVRHAGTGRGPIVVTVSDSVHPGDGFASNYPDAGDGVTPSEGLAYTGPIYVTLVDSVVVWSSVGTVGYTHAEVLSDTVSLSETAGRVFEASLSDSVSPSSSTDRRLSPEDGVQVTDSVTLASKTSGVSDAVTPSQVTVAHTVRSRSLTDQVALTEGVGFWVDGHVQVVVGDSTCRQDKSFAPNGSAPYSAPTVVPQDYVVLTWPYVSPTLTIRLRNPEFNNVEQRQVRRIARATRGGTFRKFRDPQWPKFSRLNYTVRMLVPPSSGFATPSELLDFLSRSAGQSVGLLDYEGRQWVGVVTTPQSPVERHLTRHVDAVQFEFEGSLA